MASQALVHSFFRRLSLVVALGFGAGCASAPPATPVVEAGPTLDSPYVMRVCVQPPGVPANKRFWANDNTGSLIVEDWELGHLQKNGQYVYFLDPYANPESVRTLPIPYNKLQCPEPPASVLSSNGKISPPTAMRLVEQAPKAGERTTARVAEPPPCTSTSEAGQTRALRATTTYTCRRTKTLKAPSRPAPAPVVKSAQQAPSLARVGPAQAQPASAPPALVDWNVPAPNLSGVDLQRVVECVGSLCHARHPNFIKKGGKPASGALSTGGGGGGTKPPPSTRKPPTGPKPAQPGKPVKPKASEAPKVKEPHGNRVDDRPATRYEKVDGDGKLLKHGVTKHADPNKRYTKEQIGKGRVDPVERGPRKEMIKKERDLVETNPGPENREPWAGKRKAPQAGGKNE